MNDESARNGGAGGAEFEQALHEALAVPDIRQALALPTAPVTAGELRARALAAADVIAAEAAAEYATLSRLRAADGRASRSLSGRARPAATGHGLLAALVVLTPALSAAAAVIFLLLGHVLQLVEAERSLADSLIGTGWAALVVTAVAGAAAVVGLFITAARHRATSGRPDGVALAHARAAWRKALLERGLLPFLRHQLRLPPTAAQQLPPVPPTVRRRSRPGYSRPGFTAPASPSQD
ncbi:hypothetical protein ACWCXX_21995 [Streptomyces sp. NPDC001732]